MWQAYIPLQRKTIHVRVSRWLRPPTRRFCVTYINMLVSKKSGRPNAKTGRPNASQWNIGCVGSQTQNFRVGHVHFIFLGVGFISVCPTFQWNMGFSHFLNSTCNMQPSFKGSSTVILPTQRNYLVESWRIESAFPLSPSHNNRDIPHDLV